MRGRKHIMSVLEQVEVYDAVVGSIGIRENVMRGRKHILSVLEQVEVCSICIRYTPVRNPLHGVEKCNDLVE
jgi:hypothetical protein